MEVIGNIRIFNINEIKNKAKYFYSVKINKLNIKEKLERQDLKEKLARAEKEPLPYALFRLNELLDYKLNGFGCEITEEQYYNRLEVLPPKPFKNDILEGYIVPEMITFGEHGNIYEHLFKHNNKYYCVIMETGFKVV